MTYTMAPSPTSPNLLSTILSTNSPIILDGALATYLETLGCDISSALWSASILLSQPSLIKKAHLDYFRAGANVAITASYQAPIPSLISHLGINEQEARDVVRKSVELAREARDEYITEQLSTSTGKSEDETSLRKHLWIAGSIGPYGASLSNGSEYTGAYSLPHADMKAFHRARMQVLVASGVDILACETMPSASETLALIDLLIYEFRGTEAWFSFTLRDSSHISDGTHISEIANMFQGVKQVVAIGFNCVDDEMALAALGNLKPLIQGRAMVVYPNSGESWNAGKREWEGKRTEGGLLREKTVAWWRAGARMIGGCCRTTPEDIKEMREALEGIRRE
jgi:homocysteine S-methyltransferase